MGMKMKHPGLDVSRRSRRLCQGDEPIAYLEIKAADGRILDCNRMASRIWDCSEPSILQMRLRQLHAYNPSVTAKVRNIVETLRNGDTLDDVDLHVKRRNSHLILVDLSAEQGEIPERTPLNSLFIVLNMREQHGDEYPLQLIGEPSRPAAENPTNKSAPPTPQMESDPLALRHNASFTEHYETEPIEMQIREQKRFKERMKELVETNSALSVLSHNIAKKWEDIQKQTDWKINTRILPIIENLETDEALKKYKSELDVLKACLLELSCQPTENTTSIFMLSNAEMRVASMTKNGYKIQQIARKLCISPDTVKSHRRKIRKKLGIDKSKINLASYLRAKMQ